MIRILGVNASPCDDPSDSQHESARLLTEALIAAKESGATHTDWVHLPDDLPHCDGRREETLYSLEHRISRLPKRANLEKIVRSIMNADGVIFAGPTYVFGLDSRTSALLAWLEVTTDYPDYCLKGKVAGYIAACQEDGGQNNNAAKFNPTNHMGMAVPPFCSHFYNKNAKESEGDHQKTGHILVGRNVVRLIKLMRMCPDIDWNDYLNP